MKFILLFILSFIYLFSYGQDKETDRCFIELLNHIDKTKSDTINKDTIVRGIKLLLGVTKDEFLTKIQKEQDTTKSKVVKELDLSKISEKEFQLILNQFDEYAATICISELLDNEILGLKEHQDTPNYHTLVKNLKKKIKMLDDYTTLITDNNYIQYGLQEFSKTWLKSFHIFHDNDILLSRKNADRDYTGGFRFEFTTDQFKMRLFNLLGDSKNFLSYQSIFIGGEGYTPYIRFTEDELNERNVLYDIDPETQFFTQESLDSIQNYLRSNQRLADRPFASFQYIGRGKYRLHHTGVYRIKSLFKVGRIGGSVGKNVQAVLHQDFATGSQRVLNWEDQIGNGGRFVFNIEQKIDVSIFSEHSLWSVNRELNDHIVSKFNIYMPIEIAGGTVQTHLGTGIGISNKSFREVSGINIPRLVPTYKFGSLNKILKNSYLSMEYNFRHVFHNSMLEGVGFFKPFEDNPLDDEAVTVYSLKDEDVVRNLHKLTWHIGFRINKMVLYYKHVRLINREFNVKNVTPNFEEFRTQRWYGYGRVGCNFLL